MTGGLFASLRVRVVVLLALSMFPAAVLSVAQSVSNLHLAAETAKREILQEALLSATGARDFFTQTQVLLAALASDPDLSAAAEACADRLARAPHRDRYAALIASDAEGRTRCHYPGAADGFALQGGPEMATARSERRFVLSSRLAGTGKDDGILLAIQPVTDESQQFAGAVSAAIRAEFLRLLLRRPQNGNPVATAIVDHGGRVIAEEGDVGRALSWLPDVVAEQNPFARGARVLDEARTGQAGYLYGIAPLFERDVFLLIRATSPVARVGFNMRFASTLAMPFLMWTIALAVAWYAIDRFVVRWVVYLQRITRAYSKGKLALRTGPMDEAPQEFRLLGGTMNAMAEALDEREEHLRAALDEQKALLREVYHRVKNNLQIVASLVNLQMRDVDSDEARDALSTMQGRLNALALVHRSLYEAEGLHRLDLARVLPDLVAHFHRTHAADGANVRVETDIDSVMIDPDRAVPVSLFVAEALTNAFAYNWQDGESGVLRVSLKHAPDGEITLTVANTRSGDTGGDVPHPGLGRRLMEGFARQVGGDKTAEVTPEEWRAILTFRLPDEPADAREDAAAS
ncbi:MAG: sensor histidine kinase [Alphaproteobacteria bacterium]|nr:sensor histidine kinase [Alphaproteobacteria bacterium]MDX5367943.1 sensor histidine kinase [Alphaproteobacteria bacterium]MDX5462796.1 sensor histidine kinase [Alphaproteobacteria bacterium]